jgi:hypothetical protein
MDHKRTATGWSGCQLRFRYDCCPRALQVLEDGDEGRDDLGVDFVADVGFAFEGDPVGL